MLLLGLTMFTNSRKWTGPLFLSCGVRNLGM